MLGASELMPLGSQGAFLSPFKKKAKKIAALPSSPEQGSGREAFPKNKREAFLKREKSSKDSQPSDVSVCRLYFL